LSPGNLAAIRAALEAAGVIFIDENGEGCISQALLRQPDREGFPPRTQRTMVKGNCEVAVGERCQPSA
jgi:hypothetical protein